MVLLGLLLAVGAYAALVKISERRAESGVSPVPERLASLAGPAAPSNLSPQVASILPPLTPAQLAPVPAPAPTPAPSTPTSAQAATVAPQAAPVPLPVPIPVPVSVTPAGAPAAGPVQDSRVVLKFKADSFVQVREKQGPVLLSRVMRAGEVWPVPRGPSLLLTTGNAGGTDLVVDGVAAAPLGPSGAVRRDVPLEPDVIKLPPGTKLPTQARSQ